MSGLATGALHSAGGGGAALAAARVAAAATVAVCRHRLRAARPHDDPNP